MKKKPQPSTDGPVPREVLDRARQLLNSDEESKPAAKCTVCGSPCAPISTEGLCWVCRRLKISAWRESDQQMPAQE